jgi:hypothetical protein
MLLRALPAVVMMLVCAASLRAQDSARVVVLSPLVGEQISRAERDQFLLFRKFDDYHSAMVFLLPDGRYVARILLGDAGTRRDTVLDYREAALRLMAEQIEHFEALRLGRYQMGSDTPDLLKGRSVPLAATGARVDPSRVPPPHVALPSAPPPSVKNDAQDARRNPVDTARGAVLPPEIAFDWPKDSVDLGAPSARMATLRLQNGSVVRGRIRGLDAQGYHVSTLELGELTITPGMVESIEYDTTPFGTPGTGRFAFPDPSAWRGYLVPTALPMQPGSVALSDFELFIGSVSVSLNEQAMLTGGLLFVPVDLDGQLLHFGMKATLVQTDENFSLALGGLFFLTPGSNSSVFGIPYLVGTIGDADLNLSVLAGMGGDFGSSSGSFSEITFAASVSARMSEGVKFIGETAYFPGSEGVPLILGLRFFGRSMSGDLGMMYFVGEDSFSSPIGIPVVSFTAYF